MGTPYAAGVVLTIIAGVLLALQSGCNATLGRMAGKSFSAVISFSVGLVALVIFFAIETYGVKSSPHPAIDLMKPVPWWGWLGGLMGAYYVAIVIIFAPTLGAGTLLGVFVCAQLIMAIICDTFALVGFKKRPFHWCRGLGIALLVCGVILITYFDGVHNLTKQPQVVETETSTVTAATAATTTAAPSRASSISQVDPSKQRSRSLGQHEVELLTVV